MHVCSFVRFVLGLLTHHHLLKITQYTVNFIVLIFAIVAKYNNKYIYTMSRYKVVKSSHRS